MRICEPAGERCPLPLSLYLKLAAGYWSERPIALPKAKGHNRLMSNQVAAVGLSQQSSVPYSAAVDELLKGFSSNPWFLNEYWPLNRERVGMIVSDIEKNCPKGASVFEVGCGTGYIAFLLGRMGYRVTGTDAWHPPEAAQFFEQAGVEFAASNLNHLDPFPGWNTQFDAIVLGEVIEHILNSPLQLVKRLASLLKPGGTMVVTTPNSCTAANALRMVLGTYSLWGTEDFCREPKIADGKIISNGEIHYREYSPAELRKMISAAGLIPEPSRFLPCGVYQSQPLIKRAMKRILGPLLHTRLLGAGQYVVAHKGSS